MRWRADCGPCWDAWRSWGWRRRTLLYLPVLVPVVGEMFGGYELAGWGDAEKLSVDLMGLVTLTALHPLGGDWVETLRQTQEGTSRFRDVNTVFLGWAG